LQLTILKIYRSYWGGSFVVVCFVSRDWLRILWDEEEQRLFCLWDWWLHLDTFNEDTLNQGRQLSVEWEKGIKKTLLRVSPRILYVRTYFGCL